MSDRSAVFAVALAAAADHARSLPNHADRIAAGRAFVARLLSLRGHSLDGAEMSTYLDSWPS